jgi:glutamate-1-semialdehyde 2,1-aminomutase
MSAIRATRRLEWIADVKRQYSTQFPESRTAFDRGSHLFPNHTAHAGRSTPPFPPFVRSSEGAEIKTIDGLSLIDFWQGHFCNILGHHSPGLQSELSLRLELQCGLQLGIPTELEWELADLVTRITGLQQVVFTTTGALATMYAIMLSLGRTGRRSVLKLAGGWHGVQPWALRGVRYPGPVDAAKYESAGLPMMTDVDVRVTSFNDIDHLENTFRQFGEQIGVFILELVLGNSGMVMATPAYVKRASELCSQYGTLLAVDEIVTGFRVHPGLLSDLYGLKPDIAILGKAMTGGMPLAIVCGTSDALSPVGWSHLPKVTVDGGTFTAHPLSLAAALRTTRYLLEFGNDIYPQMLARADTLRLGVSEVLNRHSIDSIVTGRSPHPSLPHFPISTVNFIKDMKRYNEAGALVHWDESVVDIEMRNIISRLFCMLRGLYLWQGLGCITTVHTEAHIESTLSVYEEFAREVSEFI